MNRQNAVLIGQIEERKALNLQPVTFDENGDPVSFVFSDIWDYSATHPHLGREAKIDFTGYLDFKNAIQEALYHMNRHNPDIAPKSVKLEAGALSLIIGSIGTSDFSLLASDSVYRKVTIALSTEYSASTIERYLGVINKLHAAGLTERYIKSPANEAVQLGRPAEQHICLPEKFAGRLFNKLIEFVETYHPYRHQISNAYKAKLAYDEQKMAEGYALVSLRKDPHRHSIDIHGQRIQIDRTSQFHKQISHSCMMLTMAFSGVRFSEACSLKKDAYFTKKVNGVDVSFITGETTKTNEGCPETVTWVTHPIVEKALELAYDSSEWARQNYNAIGEQAAREAKSCFIKAFGARSSEVFSSAFYVPSDLAKYSETFCESNNIFPDDEDIREFNLLNPSRLGAFVAGSPPKFSSHTFRRTFAVFLCRNQIGNLSALKGQYKHINAFMTKWYTNNADLARALDLRLDETLMAEIKAINDDVTAKMLFDIFNAESLSGGEGERIMSARNNAGESAIYTLAEIKAKVKSGLYSIVEHPTGYCMNPKCDRICNSDISSFTCTYEVTTKEKALKRLPELERLKNEFRKANTGQIATYGLLKHYQMKIEAIEITLAKHGVSVERFADTIKAKSLLITAEV